MNKEIQWRVRRRAMEDYYILESTCWGDWQAEKVFRTKSEALAALERVKTDKGEVFY